MLKVVNELLVVLRHEAELDVRLRPVSDDPRELAAVLQALRKDHLDVAGNLFAERETRRGVGVAGHEAGVKSDILPGLDAQSVEPKRAAGDAEHFAGQQPDHLVAADRHGIRAFGLAGQQQRYDFALARSLI